MKKFRWISCKKWRLNLGEIWNFDNLVGIPDCCALTSIGYWHNLINYYFKGLQMNTIRKAKLVRSNLHLSTSSCGSPILMGILKSGISSDWMISASSSSEMSLGAGSSSVWQTLIKTFRLSRTLNLTQKPMKKNMSSELNDFLESSSK